MLHTRRRKILVPLSLAIIITGWLVLESTNHHDKGLIDAVAAATRPKPVAPTLTITGTPTPGQSSVSITEGDTLTLSIKGVDPQSTGLGFNSLQVGTVSNNNLYNTQQNPYLPQGAKFSLVNNNLAKGEFTWTPSLGTAKTTPSVSVVFGVINTYFNLYALQTMQIKVLPRVVNHPPAITVEPTGSQHTIMEGQTLQFLVKGTDPDQDPVQLSASSLPVGASFDATTGLFVWTPETGTAARTPQIVETFQASDIPKQGNALSATYPVTLTVIAAPDAVNHPPVLLPVASTQMVTAAKPYTLTFTASDQDDDTLTFTAQPLPAGATLKNLGATNNQWNAEFNWTPSVSQVGQSYTVNFTVQDDYTTPALAAQSVVFKVLPADTSPSGVAIKAVAITQAQWNSTNATLLVQGRVTPVTGGKAVGLKVNLTDAGTGEKVGTALVKTDLTWKFNAKPVSGHAPCNVRATVDGVSGLRVVLRVPAGTCP